MRRSRIGLLCGSVVLAVAGTLPPVAAAAQPTPNPEPSATAMDHSDMLKGVLHGEGIVQTTKGPIRVAMQRGEATKLTPTSLTVQSADGFTRTWNINADTKIHNKRQAASPGALQAGVQVTVAGTAAAGTGTTGPTASPGNGNFTAKWVLVQPEQSSPGEESS